MNKDGVHGMETFQDPAASDSPTLLPPAGHVRLFCTPLSVMCFLSPVTPSSLSSCPGFFLPGTLRPTQLGNHLLQEAEYNSSHLDVVSPVAVSPVDRITHSFSRDAQNPAQQGMWNIFLICKAEKEVRTRGRVGLAHLVP